LLSLAARYQTLDVVRAVAESGRDISLYTGNDDNIVMDLITPFAFQVNGKLAERRIVGGLGPLGSLDPVSRGPAAGMPGSARRR
jgi:hypothetical protein